MKVLYTTLLLCLATIAYTQKAFKAITYNIKWNDLMVDTDSWEDRRDAMIVFFQDEEADFLGLQEVMEDQLYDLKQGLGYYESIGVGRDDGKMKGEFSPILYHKEKWQLVDNHNHWLSETPEKVSRGWDAACNRLLTSGLFVNLSTGDSLYVFNTHLDHKGEKARTNSVELIMDLVKEISDGLPVLILGDFNLDPRDHLYYSLTDDFKDANMEAYSVRSDHDGTFNGFRLNGYFDRRIDYVFYNGSLDALSYECPDIRVDGRHVSDHFPVIVVMQFMEDE